MAMNAQFLQQLGLQSVQRSMAESLMSNAPPVKPKPRKRAEKETLNAGIVPVRRSKRLRGIKEPGDQLPETAPTSPPDDEDDDAEDVVTFSDSGVLRYTCTVSAVAESSTRGRHDGELSGFVRSANARTMGDAHLKRVYSLAFSPFADHALLVAGGHQGQVSVYGIAAPTDEHDEVDTMRSPLLSFKAHSGWISCVTLAINRSRQENRLLTSGNDGVVKLWDLNQRSTASQRTGATAKPLLVVDHLHRSGIFGMDVRRDNMEMITCSKDATIALSTVRNGAVDVVRRFEDHDSVIKSVQFSRVKPELFSSGGNDRVLRVFDSRSSSKAAITIANAHARAINSVVWHPVDSNWLVSASFDPSMHLFDLRQPSLPHLIFQRETLAARQESIYHPIFLENGRYLAAPGGMKQQEIALFKTEDASAISCGATGSKVDSMVLDPHNDRILIASGTNLQFFDFDRSMSSSCGEGQ
ncbi:hypothetical protein PINS_up013898 [Pythium insidiosum]|nr:hypothetical protein PINS_up013898 [Pythium insidiosum]